jgi:hypothetical protein
MRHTPEERSSPWKILGAIKGQRDKMVERKMFSACSTHGDLRDGQKILLESRKGGAHMKNLDVSVRIVLDWILEQQDVRV